MTKGEDYGCGPAFRYLRWRGHEAAVNWFAVGLGVLALAWIGFGVQVRLQSER